MLDGLPYAAIALYLCLRRRMDFATGLVGTTVGISWQAIREDMYVESHRGPGNTAVGSRFSLLRVVAWLKRAGLVEMRSNADQRQLVFRLPKAYTRSRVLQKPAPNPHLKPHVNSERRYPQKPARSETPKPAPHPETGVINQAAAGTDGYLEIDAAELVFPPGTSTAQQRAFGAIGTKHQLSRDQLQLLLDELAGIGRKGAIRNGSALLDRLALQLKAGEFFGARADQERGGGSGLSAEEARFVSEGGRL